MAFLSPVSTVYAWNAWDHDTPLGDREWLVYYDYGSLSNNLSVFFVGVSYRKGLNLERQSTGKEAMLLSAVDEEAVIKSVGLLSDRSP